MHGGEIAALAHLAQYLACGLLHSYKRTRNGLMGLDYSAKWSPWLATGARSARQALAQLRACEAAPGASDGSYWLWFELLWRDYFRFLHLQHGRALYRAQGLGPARTTPHDSARFAAWYAGQTGQPLVDAGMRELAATGYLSNRLRQITASYLIHDLQCDCQRRAMDKNRPINALKEQLEKVKASIRAKVEHPFRVIKCQFGHRKVRYRGLDKNTSQLLVMFALSNLWMGRRHECAHSEGECPKTGPIGSRMRKIGGKFSAGFAM
jgi:hypothetical protein